VIVVYHPRYLFGSAWLNTMHPFEFDRAIQVEALLRTELGGELDSLLRAPQRPATIKELSAVHDVAYLAKAHHSRVVARIIEVHTLFWCPRFLMRRWFVDPSLWCVAGTLVAAREVLKEGLAFNIGGGFHHAKRQWGEGFCLFSDIALAIHTLRAEGFLSPQDSIFYIDLDVHQGNGVSADFADDPAVRILDVFNNEIYPFRDKVGRAGIDVSRPLPSNTRDDEYLKTVDDGLEELFADQPMPKLVIYNAGTDVFAEDLLGDMKLTREGVNRRDLTVLEAVRGRGIPLLVLSSGGYSKTSARLIADFILGAYRYEKNR
jgi:histone deacetylase 11